ncbi:MAG: TonB-dependent receptor [Tannerella sp.]|jgi:TonB-linked SusC/RagA family outer membrane protein|nr:TonB-dependent receptor [Tannerella sp.]
MKRFLLNGMKNATLERAKRMMMLSAFLLIAGMGTAGAGGSQESPEPAQSGTRITGTVVDRAGEPVIGANIVEKAATANGTITDMDGNFSLTVSQGATLVVSYIGYVTQEVATGNRTVLNITLAEDMQALEEIVVVGYGTKRKGDITSAISVIDLDNLGDIHGLDATRLIQGQAPGVVAKQKTGKPGQELAITIRGQGSLGAQSAPLYVVDGFPVGESLSQSLNPEDIESISILKDAASTSIYGARGANGVILITTRGARDGELRLTATANLGVSNIPGNRRTRVLNGPEFIQFQKESYEDRIRYLQHREPTLEDVPEAFRYPEQTKYSTDWFDEIMNQNALTQNYNVTLAEGAGKVKSVLSLGYLNQEGAVINTGFERFNARANIQGEVNEYISMGWNLAASRTNERLVDSEGRGSIIGFTYWADPSEPVYNEDGTWNDYIGGHDGIFSSANPVQVMNEEKKLQNVSRVLSSGYIEITFLNDFKFKPSVDVSLYNLRRNDFRPSTLAGGGYNVSPPPRNASMNEWNRNILNYNADLLLTYAKKIDDHSFDAMLGYTAQAEEHKELYSTGSNFPNDEIRIFQNAETFTVSSTLHEWSLLAYLARANYNYKDRYLVSASFRREGSSRFGANNKWGNFPSVSLGWRLSEEPFMPKASWLSNLKLRGSYGVTGNNSIGNYPSLAGLSSANYVLNGSLASGVVLDSYANALLGWERSNALDVGLDMSLLGNRLVFMAEYYNRLTDNMLLQKELPIITGFGTTYTNVGKVQNRGVELSLDYREKLNTDLSLRGNFNIAFNRNKVLEIMGENDYIERYDFYNMYNRSIVGHPVGMIWGYKMLGIFNTEEEIANSPLQEGAVPGVYKFWDANGDGVITYDNKDMVEIGNPHPQFTWALTLGAEYRNFDLNVLITGAQNYDLVRNIEQTTGNMDGVFNVSAEAKNRWRSPENPGKGLWPSANTWKWEREVSSRYVYDASHAWVKNISLGYTVPRGKSILKGARFYLNAENAFLITSYPGFNPDVDMDGGINLGRDDEAYPIPLILSIGTTITF